MYFKQHRRVYQGLLKLLNASEKSKEQDSTSNAKRSRKKRGVSKLVIHIALGSPINVQGNLLYYCMHSLINVEHYIVICSY